MHIEGLDLTDNIILEIIRDNAKASYTDIAEKLNISRVAVKNRINSMENKGIIKGYQTIIDESCVHKNAIDFQIDIEAKPEYFSEVLDKLAKDKYLRKIIILSGRCRIQASGYAPDTKQLSDYVNRLYSKIRGISAINLHTVLSTVKDIDGGVEYEREEDNMPTD